MAERTNGWRKRTRWPKSTGPRRCGRLAVDAGSSAARQTVSGIADRLGGGDEQDAACRRRSAASAAGSSPRSRRRERRARRRPKPPASSACVSPCGSSRMRQRVPARLGDDPVANPVVHRPVTTDRSSVRASSRRGRDSSCGSPARSLSTAAVRVAKTIATESAAGAVPRTRVPAPTRDRATARRRPRRERMLPRHRRALEGGERDEKRSGDRSDLRPNAVARRGVGGPEDPRGDRASARRADAGRRTAAPSRTRRPRRTTRHRDPRATGTRAAPTCRHPRRRRPRALGSRPPRWMPRPHRASCARWIDRGAAGRRRGAASPLPKATSGAEALDNRGPSKPFYGGTSQSRTGVDCR